MWLYVCQFPCHLVQFGNLHHIITVTKKLTRLQYRKDIKNNIFGLTCSFLYIARLFFSTLRWAARSHRAMLMRLEGVIQGNKKKTKSIKKTLWHQKSQKEQRAPSNSSSLKLEQMVVWLLVWLFILVNTLFSVTASLKMTAFENPSPLSVINFSSQIM